MFRRTHIRLAVGCLSAFVIAWGVTACSDSQSDQPPAQSSADFNQADVDFATGMSPHHAQAVIMAELAETRAGSAEVKALAADIEAAQEPEIDKLGEWILDWGSRGGSMPPHGGEHTGPGMLTGTEMQRLRNAEGTEFDRLFLEEMIRHHEGAIEMAEHELETGMNPDAKTMAQSIISSQRAQIDRMGTLLDQL